MQKMENIQAIREFWFGDNPDDVATATQQAKLWWSKNPDLDLRIRRRFETTLLAVEKNQLAVW
jgi:uncharacterized protein (DUF924 family)